jgi:CelD/BcsL family acetyltransferase involved in cellulose biosynthesis
MGYDPVHAKYSPGMYLITKTLEGLREGGVDSDIRLVDWGLGDAQYKQVLGDSNWTETSVRIFGSTVRGIWLKLVTTPVAMADAWFKRVLSDSGALQSIKTKWRRELVAKAPKGE